MSPTDFEALYDHFQAVQPAIFASLLLQALDLVAEAPAPGISESLHKLWWLTLSEALRLHPQASAQAVHDLVALRVETLAGERRTHRRELARILEHLGQYARPEALMFPPMPGPHEELAAVVAAKLLSLGQCRRMTPEAAELLGELANVFHWLAWPEELGVGERP